MRTVHVVREIERTFASACDRKGFRLVHYSLQGNHAHLIVEAGDERALGRGMKAIGARLARAVNRVFQRSGPVLADRYHVRARALRAKCGMLSPTCCSTLAGTWRRPDGCSRTRCESTPRRPGVGSTGGGFVSRRDPRRSAYRL